MHTFSRSGHFPLRDKDGGHTIGSAISDIRKLHATRKPDGAIFSRTGVMGDRSLRCRDSNFRPSLLMWPWPLPDDLHIRTWPVLLGDTPDVHISYVKAFESYRLTDIQRDRQTSYAWSLPITWQRWRSHHWVRHTQKTWRTHTWKLYFYRTGVMGDRSLHCWNRHFGRFRFLWPWPWPDDIHIRTWPVLREDIPTVQIWTSYVKAFESYRLTDRHTDRRTESTCRHVFMGTKYSKMLFQPRLDPHTPLTAYSIRQTLYLDLRDYFMTRREWYCVIRTYHNR